ncbi:hypothetical protein BD410DRAFT_805896 [Rickenella mellea]|uniref:Uncharacterized protein n=1 Tax=Rickenella mellea TaxID=50990 RepID=A0A4Y7PVZ6_9AGAM|nr:hypothetical protein BD410DRAFT_805896 [Rickenella mellea]
MVQNRQHAISKYLFASISERLMAFIVDLVGRLEKKVFGVESGSLAEENSFACGGWEMSVEDARCVPESFYNLIRKEFCDTLMDAVDNLKLDHCHELFRTSGLSLRENEREGQEGYDNTTPSFAIFDFTGLEDLGRGRGVGYFIVSLDSNSRSGHSALPRLDVRYMKIYSHPTVTSDLTQHHQLLSLPIFPHLQTSICSLIDSLNVRNVLINSVSAQSTPKSLAVPHKLSKQSPLRGHGVDLRRLIGAKRGVRTRVVGGTDGGGLGGVKLVHENGDYRCWCWFWRKTSLPEMRLQEPMQRKSKGKGHARTVDDDGSSGLGSGFGAGTGIGGSSSVYGLLGVPLAHETSPPPTTSSSLSGTGGWWEAWEDAAGDLEEREEGYVSVCCGGCCCGYDYD